MEFAVASRLSRISIACWKRLVPATADSGRRITSSSRPTCRQWPKTIIGPDDATQRVEHRELPPLGARRSHRQQEPRAVRRVAGWPRLGVDEAQPRREWDAFDLEYGSLRIEVKASGRSQTWNLNESATPRFDIAPRRYSWDATTTSGPSTIRRDDGPTSTVLSARVRRRPVRTSSTPPPGSSG